MASGDPDHHKLYREGTDQSREFFERASEVTPLGVESSVRHYDPYPLYIERADGSYIYDIDGNEYLDFLMALGPKILGHNHPEVMEAAKKQLEMGDLTATPRVVSIELMERIVDLVPSIEKVRLSNSGTEATMHALRVARSYTGREKIVKPEGGYGGAHDYALQSVLADEEALGDPQRPNTVSYGSGIPDSISDLVVTIPFNDKKATEEILREHGDEIAAILIEPVMFSAGCLKPQDGYHEFLRDLTEELGIVLIWDEVMTGFRLAPGGAQERFGIEPDMTTFAKAVGGGFQMAGFGGRAEIMDEIVPPDESDAQNSWETTAFHGGTYNGHPVSAAASIKTLDILMEENVFADIDEKGEILFEGIQDVADDVGVPANVQYIGSAGQVLMMDEELNTFRDLFKANGDQFNDWFVEAAARGVIFGIPPQGERFFTAYSHTEEQLNHAIEVAEEAFKAVNHEYE